MTNRLRFAPSPTGHVHIGNIRAAIFNWLYARHTGGQFLLRVEDTDRERSTPEAIRALLDVMEWLGLDYDEEPLYQTSQAHVHLNAAERLLNDSHAYRSAKGGAEEATLFRIPVDLENVPGVESVGPVELDIHPEAPVEIDETGISFALVSKKGKPIAQVSCLAGMRDLELVDASGACIYSLASDLGAILADGKRVTVPGAVKLRFTRTQIAYDDLVKGRLAKPLDSMRDFVVVRSDGSPVFHLANVCDDITQGITHIVRGDDHVENTYRHIFLFTALGTTPPQYGHLPMIVNQHGKPYSKRDGDAFVGDFRDKGYLPEALFNYLTLLGWSPGDDREKLSRTELVELFDLDRVLSTPAQMDHRKLQNLNGQYVVDMSFDSFLEQADQFASAQPWAAGLDGARFAEVAELLQSRTKLITDVATWSHFFVDMPEYDEDASHKLLGKPGIGTALSALADALLDTDFTSDDIEATIVGVTEAAGIRSGKLNQPIRVAVTGCTIGAGIYETMQVLGSDRSIARIRHAVDTYCTE